MSAAKKAEMLRYAMRGVELDERKERFIGWAGQMWDLDAVEVCCSMLELAREAGFLERPQIPDEPERPMRPILDTYTGVERYLETESGSGLPMPRHRGAG